MQSWYKPPLTRAIPCTYKKKDSSGLDNLFQTSRIDDQNGHLYLVINAEQTVFDVYPEH